MDSDGDGTPTGGPGAGAEVARCRFPSVSPAGGGGPASCGGFIAALVGGVDEGAGKMGLGLEDIALPPLGGGGGGVAGAESGPA